jgi:diguanylate cyclase (GGDEF)-like protein
MDAMVTALVAACAAALGAFAAAVATRLSRLRSERGLEPVRTRIDQHVRAISGSLERITASMAATAAERRADTLELALDLDELLDQIVTEAAARTGAQAVAIRVQGAGGTPVVASVGTSDGAALLETALGPPDARPFRALTINWTYGPAVDDDDAYSSALVVPVVEEGTATGALVAYAGAPGAFQSEHLRALGALADEAAGSIATARRFAELGGRSLTDALTGIRNRSGYELELEREVARAHRTGRPLSLLLVELPEAESHRPGAGEAADHGVQEFAQLLRRTVRAADIPCRRRAHEFAVVLPETRSEGAQRFYTRLREATGAMSTTTPPGQTLSVGLVEWRPNETSDALDSRAVAAVRRPTVPGAEEPEGVATAVALPRRAPGPGPRDRPRASGDAREQLLVELAREIAGARREARPLAVAAVEIDDLRRVEERLGRSAADTLRAHVAARIDDCAPESGAVHRLSEDRFAVVLPRSAAADAQSLLAVLQTSLEVRPPEHAGRPTISCGIGELLAEDDAEALLGRTEEALAQARRAGGGALIVAHGDGAFR